MNSEELFRKALLEGMWNSYCLGLANELDVRKCSKNHFLEMCKITGVSNKQIKTTRKISKRTVIALLLAAALLLLVGCAVYIHRYEIKGFWIELYEDKTEIHGGSENADLAFEYCAVTYIPAGYELVSHEQTPVSQRIIWGDTNGQVIFEQLWSGNLLAVLDKENSVTNSIQIQDTVIYYSEYPTGYLYIWNEGFDLFKLQTAEKLEEEELLKFVSGIVK